MTTHDFELKDELSNKEAHKKLMKVEGYKLLLTERHRMYELVRKCMKTLESTEHERALDGLQFAVSRLMAVQFSIGQYHGVNLVNTIMENGGLDDHRDATHRG